MNIIYFPKNTGFNQFALCDQIDSTTNAATNRSNETSKLVRDGKIAIPFKIFYNRDLPIVKIDDFWSQTSCPACFFGNNKEFWKEAMPPLSSLYSNKVNIAQIDNITPELVRDSIPEVLLRELTSRDSRGRRNVHGVDNPILKLWDETFQSLGLNGDGTISNQNIANKYFQSRYYLRLYINTKDDWDGISQYVADSLYDGNNFFKKRTEWAEKVDKSVSDNNANINSIYSYFSFLSEDTQALYISRLKAVVEHLFHGDHTFRIIGGGNSNRRVEPRVSITSPGTYNEKIILVNTILPLTFGPDGSIIQAPLNIRHLTTMHNDMGKILSRSSAIKNTSRFVQSGGFLPNRIFFGNAISQLEEDVSKINTGIDIDLHIYLLFNHLRMKCKVYICGEEYTMYLPYNFKPQSSDDTAQAKSRAQFFMYVGSVRPEIYLNAPEKYIVWKLEQLNDTYVYIADNEGPVSNGVSGHVPYDGPLPGRTMIRSKDLPSNEWANLFTPPALDPQILKVIGIINSDEESIAMRLHNITAKILTEIDNALHSFKIFAKKDTIRQADSLNDLANIFDDYVRSEKAKPNDQLFNDKIMINNLFKYIISDHNSKNLADAIMNSIKKNGSQSEFLSGHNICIESIGFYKLTGKNTYGELNQDVPNNGYESQQPGCRLFFSTSTVPQIKDTNEKGEPVDSDLETSDDKENIIQL